MNLKLTKREYLTLIKAIYLADWMANSPASSPVEVDPSITALRHKVFSHAEEAGFEEFVEHFPESDDYLESDELEKEMTYTIEQYGEFVFWNELRLRLTEKIMDAQYGAEMEGWTAGEFHLKREEITDKIHEEFSKNGFANLFILGDFRV